MTDRPFDRVPWKDLPDWYRDLVVETLHPESRQLTALPAPAKAA
ncbi:MAG: hypothetical protein M5T61_19110 [Acidimicrobiia bacterium]|nr:hypothetical protein [Acidimicrobiia bacterium]